MAVRRDHPSFSDEIKAELAGLRPAKPCCRDAELHSMIGVRATSANGRVRLRLPRNAVARTVVQLARDAGAEVHGIHKGHSERRPTYAVELTPGPALRSDATCCARAALRGLFLARGVMAEPGSGYHMEIAVPPRESASAAAVLERLGLPSKRLARRGQTIFYFKGADPITRSLGLMGANRAVVRLENSRIVRDMRGQANRRANSETANLDKRLRVAFRQAEAIRRLRAAPRAWSSLSPALRMAAALRLDHPQAGLQELADQAQVTKSTMAYRFRRLLQLSAENGLLD